MRMLYVLRILWGCFLYVCAFFTIVGRLLDTFEDPRPCKIELSPAPGAIFHIFPMFEKVIFVNDGETMKPTNVSIFINSRDKNIRDYIGS